MEEHQKYRGIIRQIMFSYGNLFMAFIFSPLLIFLLTRNLTVSEYGIYSLLSATVIVLSVIFELGFSQYLISKYPGMEKTKKITALYSLFIFNLLVLVFIMLLIFLTPLQGIILKVLGLIDYKFEFKVVLFIICIISLYRICIGYLTSEKRIELTNIMDFLKDNIWIILLVLFFLITGNIGLGSVVILWITGVVIAFFVCLFYIRRDFIESPDKRFIDFNVIKNGISFGIPIIPFFLGSWIVAIGDRYLLNYYLGPKIVGIYALAYTFAVVVANLGIAILAVFYPYIAENWNKKQDYSTLLNAALKSGLVVVIPAIIGLFFLRTHIVTLISGVPYMESASVLALLLVFPLFMFLSFLLSRILMLKNKTKSIAAIYLISAAINIFLNIILIPKIGMYGAAVATIVSYFLIFISMYVLCAKYLRLNYSYLKLPNILLSSLLMGLIVGIINPKIAITKILTIVFGALIYLSFLFLFKVFVKQELDLLKGLFLKKRLPEANEKV